MDAKQNQARIALLLVLIVAAMLRLYGLDWDQGQHTHPDERWIAMVAPTIIWPERGSELFDPRRSTLNPLWTPDGQGGGQVRNFSYGHLPLYLQSLVGHTLASLGRRMAGWSPAFQDLAVELQDYGSYGGISIVGRLLSVLSDLGIIYLVYVLGKRVYDVYVGLLGAALVAVAVMHIQLSHYATFDVMTTFFITLSVYGSVCVVQAETKRIWPTLWAGAAAGLAVASKFSAVPLIAVLVLAQLIRTARRLASQDTDMASRPGTLLTPRGVLQIVGHSWGSILLSLLAALVAFFVASPFAILDIELYAKQIAEQGSMVRGEADWPFTRQYWNTTPFLYQIVQQLRWGLWWPLGIAAFAGFTWVLIRQFRSPRAEELVLLGWTVPYFLLTGSFLVKFMRYMLPLLPLMILMGAALLWRVARRAHRHIATARVQSRATHTARRLLAATPYLVLIASALYALSFMRVYAQIHPWIQASRWIYDHVPAGSAIAREHWDDDLPLSLPEPGANPAALRLNMSQSLKLPMYEPDNYAKLLQIQSILSEADYLILASNRLYRTIPRLPDRYPVSTEFYRLLFEEELGYVREIEFTAYPGFAGLEIPDDEADESFTVYDHPKPILFRKTRDLDPSEWMELFAESLATPPAWEPKQASGGLLSIFKRGPVAAEQEGEEERTLLLEVPVGDLPVVADFGWNRLASESTVIAVLTWWLAISLLGWLAWPLTFVLCGGLRDRGYLLSRSIALVVVGYLVWLPASLHLLPNGLPLTGAAIGVLALASALLWRVYRTQMARFLRDKWRIILLGEAVFGLAFLLFVFIRILNPDLWQPWNGGEKSMDIAYLNACLRSAYLPPYDPYFAHGYLNYYYYGQFLLSILTRLTGIRATVAFNLSVPLLFAFTVSNAFLIGYTLAGRIWSRATRDGLPNREQRTTFGIAHGVLSAACVTLFGNLASATQIIERLGWIGQSTFESQIPGLQPLVHAASGIGQIVFRGARFPGFNYWDPSRVVGNTINEFPFWSFLFADLHPHMINIPFTVLVIALTLNWLLREPQPRATPVAADKPLSSRLKAGSEIALMWSSARTLWQQLDWGEILNWTVWPVALGALAAINTWDWPVYAGLSGLVLLFSWIRRRGRQGIAPALLASLALAGVSLALYAPFFRYYTALYVGLGWSLGRGYTKLGEFLSVWGFFLFLALSFLCVLLVRQRSRWALLRLLRLVIRTPLRLHRAEALCARLVDRERTGLPLSLWIIAAILGALVWWATKGYWVLVLGVPSLLLALALMVQERMPEERRFVLALIFAGFLLVVGVELLYLKDFLAGGDAWRMNTLFKFYMQIWVITGIAVGASLPGLWAAVEKWRKGWRWAWRALFALLLFSVSLYPLLGTVDRVLDRFPGARPPIGTLDGMAFMTVGTYTWPNDNNPIRLRGDYWAIRWLMDHVQGTPVLAEAPIGYYREFGVRVSSYTGLPTLKGMHQAEQRYGWQVGQRDAMARDLFMSSDQQRTLDLLEELDVEYVYIGPLERTLYASTLSKFAELAATGRLSVVYENDLVTIYEVERGKTTR